MANIIISDDFLDLGTITSRTEATGYPDDNVEDYWHLGKRFRADDATDTDWLLKFNMGAARSVAAIMLNNVNFDHVQFQLHSADAWGAPDHDSGDLTVSLNTIINRYNIIYVPSAVVTKQWLQIYIPATASPVGSYTTKWEVGSVVVLDSYTQFGHNMSWGYSRKAVQAYQEMPLPHGGFEIANLGDHKQWIGRTVFGARAVADEADLWTLNQIAPGSPMVFYENDSDTSKVYLCVRSTDYEGTIISNAAITGSDMEFRELI
jgi:hypothetical protein